MIEISGLTKRFGETLVLDQLDLTVPAGTLLALLGPSGSGKSTVLRIIAGLEAPDAGALRLDGQDAAEMTPGARRIGFVFQGYALFAHMTAAENIAFGLQVMRRPQRPGRAEIAAEVQRLLRLVRLEGLGNRLPAQLSGGQCQRVALARALAIRPRILLLDEPFGALDREVRDELRGELRRVHDELAITTVLVTHDREDAAVLADRVVTLNRGRVVNDAAPAEASA
jgi:sulfate transport system ATP-binding protein